MSTSSPDTNPKDTAGHDAPRRRNPWVKALKIIGFTLLGLIVLIAVVFGVALSWLKPARLTPLVREQAEKMMDARVDLGRVKLSFFSTFPNLVLDIRDLHVRTNAFDRLPDSVRSRLPQYADSLVGLRHLNASVNIPRLLAGEIALSDILLTAPYVNLVQATPQVSGIDIFPPSENKSGDEGPLSLPDISLSTFGIDSVFPVRYLSLPDSTDISVTLVRTQLDGRENPLYTLSLGGNTSARIGTFILPPLGVGIGGKLRWSPKRPLNLLLDDFEVSAADVKALVSADLDLNDPMTVGTMQLTVPQTPLNSFIRLIPADMRGELDKVDARFTVGLTAALTAPYRIGVDSLPSLTLDVEIPGGTASYDGMRLDDMALDATARVDGDNPDASVIEIRRLFAKGEGMGFELDARVTNPLSDPVAKGSFKGGLSVARLPKKLLSMIPGTVKGLLKANLTFGLRKSYLTKENFHRISLKGDADLTGLDVNIPAFPVEVFSRHINLDFGTNSSYTRGGVGVTVDSLLTASLKVDTLACSLPGMDLQCRDVAVGVGCRNTGSSIDTTQINPIGGRIEAGFLQFHATDDSMRVRLRHASVGAVLTRYKGEARKPLLALRVKSERAFYADRFNRAFLTRPEAAVAVHPSITPAAERRRAVIDSLRRLHPGVPTDSLVRMWVREHPRRHRVSYADSLRQAGGMDIEVDNSIRRLLRRWQAAGHLRTERAMAFTPYFPLRTRISGLNLTFTTDSVNISETRVRCGHSDFRLDGTISNLSRALTTRSGRQDIVVRFDLLSDTININEITAATFAGAAFAESHPSAPLSVDSVAGDDTEQAVDAAVASASTDTAAVLVVPANLDARITVNAANIIYSDITLRDFRGSVNCYDGALNLSELTASTDVGAIDLNALYTAPTVRDASFAFGMRVKDFNVRQFLDLMPSLDTLMPLLNNVSGIINADLAATTRVDSLMNIDIPSLKAALKISGDSLVLLDNETFRTVGKWLMFKNKNRNIIDSMAVEMIVDNSQLRLFPFIFNMDRYRLGIMGSNDLALNFNYHVAVIKSPLPFRFGVNISGNPDHFKVRLGKAKFNDKNIARTVVIADTTRINLVSEITNAFRRGVNKVRMRGLDFSKVAGNLLLDQSLTGDTISHADSLYFIQQGVIPAPPQPDSVAPAPQSKKKSRK